MLKLLSKIAEGAVASSDLVGAMIESGYGASFNKLDYAVQRRQRERGKEEDAREKRYAEYRQYYSMLGYLKKDKLIEERFVAGKKLLRVTTAGLDKFKFLKKKSERALPSPKYTATKSDVVLIVSFDVPEKQRRKRDWLRSALQNMDFKMVQQSVWVGKVQLPRAFLADVRDMQLARCLEIFKATKTGSLRRVL